jgi:hypothetical protein
MHIVKAVDFFMAGAGLFRAAKGQRSISTFGGAPHRHRDWSAGSVNVG